MAERARPAARVPEPAQGAVRPDGSEQAPPRSAWWRLGGRSVGLRPRLTLVSTVVVALVSALLLWLGWLLVGGVARAVPSLPPGTTVRVGDRIVPAEQLSDAVGAAARGDVLAAGPGAVPPGGGGGPLVSRGVGGGGGGAPRP